MEGYLFFFLGSSLWQVHVEDQAPLRGNSLKIEGLQISRTYHGFRNTVSLAMVVTAVFRLLECACFQSKTLKKAGELTEFIDSTTMVCDVQNSSLQVTCIIPGSVKFTTMVHEMREMCIRTL